MEGIHFRINSGVKTVQKSSRGDSSKSVLRPLLILCTEMKRSTVAISNDKICAFVIVSYADPVKRAMCRTQNGFIYTSSPTL